MQELQQASQQAASQAATLQQLQDELQHLAATQQQLTMQVEAAGSSSDTLSRQVQGMSHSVQQLEAQLAAHVTDAVAMAECMAGCMAAARAQASSSPPASSYLSTLLGPAVAPPVAAAGTAKRQEAWGAWVSVLMWHGVLMAVSHVEQGVFVEQPQAVAAAGHWVVADLNNAFLHSLDYGRDGVAGYHTLSASLSDCCCATLQDANLAQLSGLVSRMRRHHHHQPQAACSSCTSQTLQGSPVR